MGCAYGQEQEAAALRQALRSPRPNQGQHSIIGSVLNGAENIGSATSNGSNMGTGPAAEEAN